MPQANWQRKVLYGFQNPLDLGVFAKTQVLPFVKLSTTDLINQVVPGSVLGMNQSDLKHGMFVKVLAGPYKDTEGVLEDVQPECSAVRIDTREGIAYALLDDLKVIPSLQKGAEPQAVVPRPVRQPLRRK